ncbi:hypothetical protein PR048_007393 [Dryococelus australis]|uniref:Uncharacterized protein n=1 Tax=Dryococelus australis TaxID=614101 RepID=A0ABQ9HU51_9NEOP|nr:hypothetical protein PR048_007393 [Dryococelus australis]
MVLVCGYWGHDTVDLHEHVSVLLLGIRYLCGYWGYDTVDLHEHVSVWGYWGHDTVDLHEHVSVCGYWGHDTVDLHEHVSVWLLGIRYHLHEHVRVCGYWGHDTVDLHEHACVCGYWGHDTVDLHEHVSVWGYWGHDTVDLHEHVSVCGYWGHDTVDLHEHVSVWLLGIRYLCGYWGHDTVDLHEHVSVWLLGHDTVDLHEHVSVWGYWGHDTVDLREHVSVWGYWGHDTVDLHKHGHGGRAVNTLASHQGELSSIPGRVTRFSFKWESCRTMPFVGGFSRGSILTSIALIGSQDLAVKSRPNLFTSLHSHSRELHYERDWHFLVRTYQNYLGCTMWRGRDDSIAIMLPQIFVLLFLCHQYLATLRAQDTCTSSVPLSSVSSNPSSTGHMHQFCSSVISI